MSIRQNSKDVTGTVSNSISQAHVELDILNLDRTIRVIYLRGQLILCSCE